MKLGSIGQRGSDKPGIVSGWGKEIGPLCALIYARILGQADSAELNPNDQQQVDELKRQVSSAQRQFIESRISDRLHWYVRTVNSINSGRVIISSVTAGAGALVAGITAGQQKASNGLSWQNYLVIGLGILVAVLGAIGPRLVRVEQVERYRRGANRIRLEAWRFVEKRDRYAELDDAQEAYAAFVDAIDVIENEAIATDSDISRET